MAAHSTGFPGPPPRPAIDQPPILQRTRPTRRIPDPTSTLTPPHAAYTHTRTHTHIAWDRSTQYAPLANRHTDARAHRWTVRGRPGLGCTCFSWFSVCPAHRKHPLESNIITSLSALVRYRAPPEPVCRACVYLYGTWGGRGGVGGRWRCAHPAPPHARTNRPKSAEDRLSLEPRALTPSPVPRARAHSTRSTPSHL